jgi:hypothetical protein
MKSTFSMQMSRKYEMQIWIRSQHITRLTYSGFTEPQYETSETLLILNRVLKSMIIKPPKLQIKSITRVNRKLRIQIYALFVINLP